MEIFEEMTGAEKLQIVSAGAQNMEGTVITAKINNRILLFNMLISLFIWCFVSCCLEF